MFGVLCIYLLIGMLFSASFGLIQSLSNEDFFTDGRGVTADFLYYSFSTLTTTGYGDLVAATEPRPLPLDHRGPDSARSIWSPSSR